MRLKIALAFLFLVPFAHARGTQYNAEDFLVNLQTAYNSHQLDSICQAQIKKNENPFEVRSTLLKGFIPNYFFRNVNLSGTEIVALGNLDKKFGIYQFDSLTGKANFIRDDLATDAVPLLGLHSGDTLMSFPRYGIPAQYTSNNDTSQFHPGLHFNLVDRNESGDTKLRLLHTAIDVSGTYQSFGKLSGDSKQTKFRFLTDTNYASEKPTGGLFIGEVIVDGSGENTKVNTTSQQQICRGHILQLPMLSPDGQKIVATEYDPVKQKAETRVFDISNGQCQDKKLNLGFYGGKGSISFDGKQVALSLPRAKIHVDSNLDGLKSLSPEMDKRPTSDIVVIDLDTGKRKILTNNSSNAVFPTFNIDGTINAFEQKIINGESQTFLVRLDPSRESSKALRGSPYKYLCQVQGGQIVSKLQPVADVLYAMCSKDISDIHDNQPSGEVRLDSLSKDQCEKLMNIFWKTPGFKNFLQSSNGFKVLDWAEGEVKHKPDPKNILTQKEMSEFCKAK